MRIHHYVFIFLGLFLILFGLYSGLFPNNFEDDTNGQSLIILDDLIIGETVLPDGREVLEYASPIYLQGNSNEVVLIFHGFLGSPQELQELANYCLDDVKLTKDIYEYGLRNSIFKYWSKDRTEILQAKATWPNHQDFEASQPTQPEQPTLF